MNFHQKDLNAVFSELNTSEKGLSGEEAAKRLDEYGLNELAEKRKKTPLGIFIHQFKDFMILVLIVAATSVPVCTKAPTDSVFLVKAFIFPLLLRASFTNESGLI